MRKDIDSIDKFKVLHVFYFLHVYNARFTEYNFCIYIDKHWDMMHLWNFAEISQKPTELVLSCVFESAIDIKGSWNIRYQKIRYQIIRYQKFGTREFGTCPMYRVYDPLATKLTAKWPYNDPNQNNPNPY